MGAFYAVVETQPATAGAPIALGPLAAAVPAYATSAVLVLVGLTMFQTVTSLDFARVEDALPHARRAVQFLRGHEPSRQMLADLERALGAGP